jgi:hypothetical protein
MRVIPRQASTTRRLTGGPHADFFEHPVPQTQVPARPRVGPDLPEHPTGEDFGGPLGRPHSVRAQQ